jgi:hypothetical protein
VSNSITEPVPAQRLQQAPSAGEQAALGRLLFEHIENQIKSADWKAWLTVAANGLLVTLSSALLTEVDVSKTTWHSAVLVGHFVVVFFMYVAILFSLWYAVNVVKPALMASDSNNLFFFKNIARLPEQSFIQTFNGQTREVAASYLLAEVHAKAVIAEQKFSLMQRSLSGFFFALAFGVLSLILLVVARLPFLDALNFPNLQSLVKL